jgi:hypothetical protein
VVYSSILPSRFGLFEVNRAHYGLLSRLRKRQFGYVHQVIGCHSQLHPELIALGPLVSELAAASHCFDPTKDLLNPLANPLAGFVTRMVGSPPVQYCSPAAGYMRRDNPIPAAIDEIHIVLEGKPLKEVFLHCRSGIDNEEFESIIHSSLIALYA